MAPGRNFPWALGVSAPETRMPDERIEPIVAALRRVATDAQRRLP